MDKQSLDFLPSSQEIDSLQQEEQSNVEITEGTNTSISKGFDESQILLNEDLSTSETQNDPDPQGNEYSELVNIEIENALSSVEPYIDTSDVK